MRCTTEEQNMNQYTDYTLDLETWGNGPTSLIVAIGAVAFNRDTRETSEPFYVNVDAGSCAKHGLTIDADTMYWWLQQEDAARQALLPNRIPLQEALGKLYQWVNKNCRKARCWTHATFDAPILANAYRACDMLQPTHFSNQRDIRTLTDLWSKLPKKTNQPRDREGVHHNAGDDAAFQARYLVHYMQDLQRATE